jgi:peptidoglycan hydrolase-like protein with peptidoglycan-binding domain
LVDTPHAPSRSAARDPIAELIRGSEMTGSAPPPTRPGEGRTEPQRLVAWAQRALLKLGYGPLKTDGVFGQETRQAIARFERDRRLTQTGELGPRTVRELSAQSGIRVE